MIRGVDLPQPWIDLLDPAEDDLGPLGLPADLHPRAWSALLQSDNGALCRPTLEAHGDYIFGRVAKPVAVREEDRIYFQEVVLVLTAQRLVTVRRTPSNGDPFTMANWCKDAEWQTPGMLAFQLYNDVALGFLNGVDDLNAEINELEDKIDSGVLPEEVRKRMSSLRQEILSVRAQLSPTRDAVRHIIEQRVDTTGEHVFPREVELHFRDTYDTLLRAQEGLDACRDLLAGVRDYHTSQMANAQNVVMKHLTVIASILLFPTLVVGIYGQNFDSVPELHWGHGYLWSWGLILVSTIGQIIFFRRKGWI